MKEKSPYAGLFFGPYLLHGNGFLGVVWRIDAQREAAQLKRQGRRRSSDCEATGCCLAIKTARHLRYEDVKATLIEPTSGYGTPRKIWSDNANELLASALREEIDNRNIKLAYIELGKPRQNGSTESFNGTFHRECLDTEIFGSLMEAKVVIEKWRRRCDEHWPYGSQGYIRPGMANFGLREKRKTRQAKRPKNGAFRCRRGRMVGPNLR